MAGHLHLEQLNQVSFSPLAKEALPSPYKPRFESSHLHYLLLPSSNWLGHRPLKPGMQGSSPSGSTSQTGLRARMIGVMGPTHAPTTLCS